MNTNTVEDHVYDMEFIIKFDSVPWLLSPLAARELIRNAMVASGIGTTIKYSVHIESVQLENKR